MTPWPGGLSTSDFGAALKVLLLRLLATLLHACSRHVLPVVSEGFAGDFR
jgi:hypothetical protein